MSEVPEYIIHEGERYRHAPEPVKDVVVRLREGMMDGWSGDAFCVDSETAEDAAVEIEALRHILRCIACIEQGAGGNMTYEEMAKSAIRQAKDAIEL